MNSVKAIFGVMLIVVFSVVAEVKPEGTLLDTNCGKNAADAGQRNRTITEVCLAVVQGLKTEFVVIRAEDAQRKPLEPIVLPVLRREKAKGKIAAPFGVKTETLILGSNTAAVAEDGYLKYKTTRATLRSKKTVTPPLVHKPIAIRGTDLDGIEFRVPDMEAIPHTESLSEELNK